MFMSTSLLSQLYSVLQLFVSTMHGPVGSSSQHPTHIHHGCLSGSFLLMHEGLVCYMFVCEFECGIKKM